MSKNGTLNSLVHWLIVLAAVPGCGGTDVADKNEKAASLEQEFSPGYCDSDVYPTGSNCSSDHLRTLSVATFFSAVYTQKVSNAYNANPNSATAQKWFGTQTPNGISHIQWVFQNVLNQFAANNTLFECYASKSDYAASCPGRPRKGVDIYDPLFWNAPGVGGYNTQIGVIAHEFTHTAGYTHDITDVFQNDGPPMALNLAITDPANTPYNATSYQYFIEETALQ